tara:strand:- start:110 stop:637 length:528 start_codon:yes stop_codon:yes gene_type:complete
MSGVKGQPKKGSHEKCVAEGCSNAVKYKGMGLCSSHRNRLSRQSDFYAKFQSRNVATGECCADGCKSKVLAKGLCKTCYMQEYAKENPQKICAMAAKRRASLRNRTPNWLSDDDLWLIEEVYSLAQMRTKLLGFKWHVDHILPLHGKKVSGLHVPSNLQVIPAIINQQKSAIFNI